MYFVYALRSINRNYIYVGITDNIIRRFNQHNKGTERTTRSYKPFQLMYTEKFDSRILARKKEKYLKSGAGKEFLKGL